MTSVWYVAYGSNVGRERFRCYLEGGMPAGGRRLYPGCRDQRAPTAELSVDLPGRLVFAGRSLVWGGGLALFDTRAAFEPEVERTVAARAYLLTPQQFADVAAQETRHEPGGEFAQAIEAALPDLDVAHVQGPGNYETVVRVGEHGGSPLLTITREAVAELPTAAPAPAYLWWVGTGLRDAHRWTDAETTAYLLDAPGVQGAWESDDVLALLRAPEPPAALG